MNAVVETPRLYPMQQATLDRLRAAVCFADSVSKSDKWIEHNTRDPKNKDLPWSFLHHEYQIDICLDMAPEQVVQKCSQVGATELSVRRALCFVMVLQGTTVIYTLPTHKMAQKFVKQRFDPAITASPSVSQVLNSDVDNTEMKQLGDSFLLISGTFGDVAAISVPAQILIKDERNFSNSEVLGKFSSRLRHNLEGEAIMIEFSTPTLPGYGVSETFAKSDKKYYAVLHDMCGKWVIIRPEKGDVVIPGFNDIATHERLQLEAPRTILDYEREHLDDPYVDVDRAWYKCPECSHEITHHNLCQPEKRKWIATAESPISGRQIYPHDVPVYNRLPKILRQITDYTLKSDYINFVWGLPFSDSTTRFDVPNMKIQGAMVEPAPDCATGCLAGLDLGKSSWYMVGKPVSEKELEVLYVERIENSEDGRYLKERVDQLNEWFGVGTMVMDTMPDISTFRGLKADAPEQHTFGCQYGKIGKTTKSFKVDEETQIVDASRTSTFNSTASLFNQGRIYCRHLKDEKTLKEHLGNIHRVTEYNADGEIVHRWISDEKDDHYAHCMNYLNIAWQMREYDFGPPVPPASPMVRTVGMKTAQLPKMDLPRARR